MGLLYIYYAGGGIFIIFITVGSFPKEALCSHSTLSQSRKARNLFMTNPNFISWGGPSRAIGEVRRHNALL